ncbi:MAG: SusE domain-containing protein [Bacteroidales bacterium]|nr:SusE domain-containing protein [Bacteroidales bacterium]
MKHIFNAFFLIAALSMTLMTGCSKKESSSDNLLLAPEAVNLPRDGYVIDLATEQTLLLDWVQSMGGNVRYQVLFDKIGGDFSNPVYAVMSDGNGYSPYATILASTLRSIATLAGGFPGSSVDVLWTVRTWLGNQSITGFTNSENRSFTIVIPEGPIIIPESDGIYIKGSAEDGQKFTRKGVCEIFTSILASDAFYFMSESGIKFAPDATGKSLVGLDDEEEPAFRVPQDGVYRIQLDLTDCTASIEAVGTVKLKQNYHRSYDMTYDGRGSWKLEQVLLHWDMEGWGLETRYHFTMQVGGALVDWGCVNNYDRPSTTSDIGTDYFWIMQYEGNDDWLGSFKYPDYLIDLDMNERWSADVILYLRGEESHYTHEFVNPEDHYEPPTLDGPTIAGPGAEDSDGILLDPALPLNETATAENCYETFRHFNADSFTLRDADYYYVLEDGGTISTSADETDAMTLAEAGEYNLKVDLGNMTWTMARIYSMIMYWHPYAAQTKTQNMTYEGAGVWTTGDFTFSAWMPSELRSDARYHFRMFYNADANQGEHLGRADGQSYNRVFRYNWSISEWDNVWKPLDGSNESDSIAEGKTVEVRLYLNTTEHLHYYQEMIIKN